jgi:hypothetical protein
MTNVNMFILNKEFLDFQKRIKLYFMNGWFERNQWLKMVILVKILKNGQLQMSVESRKPIMLSDFFA